jgi:hypothetical protein
VEAADMLSISPRANRYAGTDSCRRSAALLARRPSGAAGWMI